MATAKGIEQIEKLINRFRSIPIEQMFQRVSERNKAIIEDKNIAQMEAGVNPEGDPIEPPYTEFTTQVKKALGQPFDRVTLKDKGDYHKGTTANILPGGIEMINKDSKWGKLTEKYGKTMGLTEQSREELNEELFIPEVGEELKTYLTT